MKIILPSIWDKRIIKRFAFFPTVADGEMRWLEMVTIEQEYEWWGKWTNLRFIDKQEKI